MSFVSRVLSVIGLCNGPILRLQQYYRVCECINECGLEREEEGRKRLRWYRGSVLTFGTQVRGLKPGRSLRIFQGEKNPQHAFLRRGSKAVGPMS